MKIMDSGKVARRTARAMAAYRAGSTLQSQHSMAWPFADEKHTIIEVLIVCCGEKISRPAKPGG
jgi:hypothetical protein